MSIEIQNISDLTRLIENGFSDWKSLGNVYTKQHGDLILFNYSPMAQIEGNWNYFETISRGLIINSKTLEIVARPFNKFFNYGEGGRFPKGHIVTITEKIDGSLGILYRDNGEYRIATRGSFDSDQALWATEFLATYFNLDGLPDNLTLLFEIVYPDNRIVVDYGKREDLVLLAIRERDTGGYWDFFSEIVSLATAYGFSLPKIYQFNNNFDILEKIARLDATVEGYVVEYSSGQRFKFKSLEYLRLHRLIASVTPKNIHQAMLNGFIEQFLVGIPDEFLTEARQWIAEIEEYANSTEQRVMTAFINAPQQDGRDYKEYRKAFAAYVMQNHRDLSSYLFAKFDGRPIREMILKSF